ncbi:MAG TPA: hypothetical protein VK688_04225, partial [Gemmatimonadales bacterium]|nr:hypothetical protein [Gemmatimonadales bacterium]
MLDALQPVAGVHAEPLLAAYHRAESILEARPFFRPYREVLTDGLGLAARRVGVPLAEGKAGVFVEAWPSMPISPTWRRRSARSPLLAGDSRSSPIVMTTCSRRLRRSFRC